jgi:hypothetical protein
MEPDMGKYDALGHFLRRQREAEIPMSFSEIERVTATKLPPSAHRHRPWWSNNARNSVMTQVWLDAGFRTEQVDMEGRKLVFRRIRNSEPVAPGIRAKVRGDAAENRHPLFGALKGLLRIMPGTDLTKPADPDWADGGDKAK